MLKNALKWIFKFLAIFFLVNVIAFTIFFMLNYRNLRDWYVESKLSRGAPASETLEDRLYNPFDSNSFEKTLNYGKLDCANFENNEMAGKMFALINADRQKEGLAPYDWNEKLCQSAILKAGDMAQKSYFDHVSPEGIPPTHWMEAVSYIYSASGENLALNTYTAEEAHEGLMNSPGHRANILDGDFTQIGIAYSWGKIDGQDAFFVVEHFGTPGSASAPETIIICQDKSKTEKQIKKLEKQKKSIEKYLDEARDIKKKMDDSDPNREKVDDYLDVGKEQLKELDEIIKKSRDYLKQCDN